MEAGLAAAPASIEIRAADSGAPEVYLGGVLQSLTLSISHSHGRSFCAVAPDGRQLGCDLEHVEPRSPAFLRDFLAPSEQAAVAAAERPEQVANLLWSAKESALKALRTGLRIDTRRVVASLGPAGESAWASLEVDVDGTRYSGWWRLDGGFGWTMVALPGVGAPTGSAGRARGSV